MKIYQIVLSLVLALAINSAVNAIPQKLPDVTFTPDSFGKVYGGEEGQVWRSVQGDKKELNGGVYATTEQIKEFYEKEAAKLSKLKMGLSPQQHLNILLELGMYLNTFMTVS